MSITITGNDIWTIAAAIITVKLAWHCINGVVVILRDCWRDAWRDVVAKRGQA